MKNVSLVLACVAALALPATSSAAAAAASPDFAAHLARSAAAVAKLHARCDVATPPRRCSEAEAKLSARLNAWASRIEARISKVSARPGSGPKKIERLAVLNGRLAQVKALAAGV